MGDFIENTRDHVPLQVSSGEIYEEDCSDDTDLEGLTVEGYNRPVHLTVLFAIVVCLSFGLGAFLPVWCPAQFIYLFAQKTPILKSSFVLITGDAGRCDIVPLKREKGKVTMKYRFLPYYFDDNTETFKLFYFRMDHSFSYITKNMCKGNCGASVTSRLETFGPNTIEVPIKTIPGLLLEEMVEFAFLFHIFSVGLWVYQDYLVYAATQLAMGVSSAVFSVWDTRTNLLKLQSMARIACSVTVLRRVSSEEEPEAVSIMSSDIVPGDVVELQCPFVVPCDMVLLNGQCIVNESMLTGESTPVVKVGCIGVAGKYDPETDTKHTLFAGTQIIKMRKANEEQQICAIAFRTGYQTAKGSLVRSIQYPRPTQHQFYVDSVRFIIFMASIAGIVFLYSLYQVFTTNERIETVMLRFLELLTTVVPPELSVTMSIGVAFALRRLGKEGIRCVSPPRVNMCGTVSMVCFDKTGTLTEEGLDVMGIRPSVCGVFHPSLIPQTEIFRVKSTMPELSNMVDGLATCHDLSDYGGTLIGDPLEIKMFNTTGWRLLEPQPETRPTPNLSSSQMHDIAGGGLFIDDSIVTTICKSPEGDELEIKIREDFTSERKRMGVLVSSRKGRRCCYYLKGAPEVIVSLCCPESVPRDFEEVLMSYTREGFRVLAIASRRVDYANVDTFRSGLHLEVDLQLDGLLIFQNKLKENSKAVVETLNNASLLTLMVTGDNALTAVSIARECGILTELSTVYVGDLEGFQMVWSPFKCQFDLDRKKRDECAVDHKKYTSHQLRKKINEGNKVLFDKHGQVVAGGKIELAITGPAFSHMKRNDPFLLLQLLGGVKVYARMTSAEKAHIVETWQDRGHCVAMVGDGANDCSALKTAHVGISLSVTEAEASVAAPFTAPEIESVVTTLREGRAALVTSMQCFKFIVLYSLIASTALVLLFQFDSIYGDLMFLYIDMILIMPLSVLMVRTGAARGLESQRPSSRLISTSVVVELAGLLLIQYAFLVSCLLMLRSQEWYEPLEPTGEVRIVCSDTTALFLVNIFQHLAVALTESLPHKYRKPVYTNKPFTLALLALTCSSLFLLLSTAPVPWFDMTVLPYPFRLRLLALIAANSLATVGYGYVLLPCLAAWAECALHRVVARNEDGEWGAAAAPRLLQRGTSGSTKAVSPGAGRKAKEA